METFENLEEIWNRQPEPPLLSAADIELTARNQAKIIKAKHRWTIFIISITVSVLIAYFIWIAASHHPLLFWGLGIMIAVLLLRIVMEYISMDKLNGLSAETSFIEFAEKLRTFYHWRRKIHLVLTPIVYGSYIVGFILLLPVFHTVFSSGFFWYIVISGLAFFVVFGFFMVKQIRNELKILFMLNNKLAASVPDKPDGV